MSNIRKFMDLINDDLAWYSEFWEKPTTTTYRRGVWVDTDKFDVIPRPEYRRQLLTKKEAELKELQEKQEKIKQEISELKK